MCNQSFGHRRKQFSQGTLITQFYEYPSVHYVFGNLVYDQFFGKDWPVKKIDWKPLICKKNAEGAGDSSLILAIIPVENCPKYQQN